MKIAQIIELSGFKIPFSDVCVAVKFPGQGGNIAVAGITAEYLLIIDGLPYGVDGFRQFQRGASGAAAGREDHSHLLDVFLHNHKYIGLVSLLFHQIFNLEAVPVIDIKIIFRLIPIDSVVNQFFQSCQAKPELF